MLKICVCHFFNQVASIFHLGKEKIKKVFFWAYLMISGIGIGLEFLRFQDSQSFTGIQEEDVPWHGGKVLLRRQLNSTHVFITRDDKIP